MGECGKNQGAGLQATCSEAVDEIMWLEERGSAVSDRWLCVQL